MSFSQRIEAARLAGMNDEQKAAYLQARAIKEREAALAARWGQAIYWVLVVGICVGVTWVLQLLWNAVIPSLNGPVLSYQQSFALLALVLFFKWLLSDKKAQKG